MGFKRNLSAEEIGDQVLFWRQWMRREGIRENVSNVVSMGMGEPMLNFDAVKESARRLSDPELFALGRRSIAVSTAGVVPGMDRFTREMAQVHLALSLHAANDALRSRLVPINRKWPLADLREALKRYLVRHRRRVFLEWVLLGGVNDSKDHAEELVEFVRKTGHLGQMHANLIVWNPTDTPFTATPRERAREFKELLLRRGLSATIRKNLGQDIAGACGQLVVRAREFPGTLQSV
jgi:adenine C2-methylase RlmN of 23S rRNA A2503 and tRNA A37